MKTKKRGLSPVISTVILVAVSISVAIAVSFWLSGMTESYTRFEQLEIQSSVCRKDTTDPLEQFWNISLTVKNTGTRDITLVSAFINGIEVDTYGVPLPSPVPQNEWSTTMDEEMYLATGVKATIYFYLDPDKSGVTISSGTTVNLRIHSSSGMDYPKLIGLT